MKKILILLTLSFYAYPQKFISYLCSLEDNESPELSIQIDFEKKFLKRKVSNIIVRNNSEDSPRVLKLNEDFKRSARRSVPFLFTMYDITERNGSVYALIGFGRLVKKIKNREDFSASLVATNANSDSLFLEEFGYEDFSLECVAK